MADVDRAVAAASGSAAETVAASEAETNERKRSCTNSNGDDAAESERVLRRKLNIDESEDDGPISQDEGLDNEDIPAELLSEGLPRNRRLSGKVPAGNTEYSNTKLVTKTEASALRG